jgi:uncharacterized protein (DUF2235 family)
MGTVDWEDMTSGSFVKLVNGQPIKMGIRNWRPQDKFKDDNTGELRKGLTFDVFAEEGKGEVTKEWTVTSMRAMGKLRPICEKAEAEGRADVFVSVTRAGEGKATVYEITEVEAF